MLDFCVTIPCGIIIMAGGVIGFLVAGSRASLVAGGGCGGLLTLLGYGGYMEYKRRGTVSKLWTTASLVISNAISIMMVKRIRKTGNMMPSAPVAILGMGMTMFYLYRLKKDRAVKKKD